MTTKSSKNSPDATPNASAIWGGRFDTGPGKIMEEINSSIDFDKRLYAEDIAGSRAHCTMLAHQNIISTDDRDAILKGLDMVEKEIESGRFTFDATLEDIHMNIESRLADLAGEAAGRLHTARSRNDQVATDLRLWLRTAMDGIDADLGGLQEILINRAEEHAGSVMPGFTHLQSAQPITLGHHLLAYVEMFGRDRGRIRDCRRRLNECPLGAAALAGTSFPIDRQMTATALGFDRPSVNSVDAVSDRDFVLEFLGAGAIIAVHLSRFAEELVLWCSVQFGFAHMPDSFSTGSSIMPQKRNPDAAELVRAKTGRVIGALNTLLVVIKGLPLAYGKDMQEDKEPAFDAADTLALSIRVVAGMLEGMTFNTDRMKTDAGHGFATATDLADWLVRVLNLPFRQAHHVTGQLVKRAEEKGCDLDGLSLQDMQSVENAITSEVFDVLSVEKSVQSRNSFGGTSPENVLQAVVEARKNFIT